MKTIKVNIKGDRITGLRAQAEAGINYASISGYFLKEKKAQFGAALFQAKCVKVILISKDSCGKRIQGTYYCLPE